MRDREKLRQIKMMLPKIKLVIILRNPVDRTFSGVPACVISWEPEGSMT